MLKRIKNKQNSAIKCFYSKSLFYDELNTAEIAKRLIDKKVKVKKDHVESWLKNYNEHAEFPLNEEQYNAVLGIPGQAFSRLWFG